MLRGAMYARVRLELGRHPRLAVSFLGGSFMHALGHGALALAAGACARALTSIGGGSGPVLFGSTSVGLDALSLGLLGLGAVIAKTAGGAIASWAQAKLSGEVGTSLRLDVLEHRVAVASRLPRNLAHEGTFALVAFDERNAHVSPLAQ